MQSATLPTGCVSGLKFHRVMLRESYSLSANSRYCLHWICLLRERGGGDNVTIAMGCSCTVRGCMQIISPQTAFYGLKRKASLLDVYAALHYCIFHGHRVMRIFILFFLSLSACTKSVQIPSEWLDYALFTVMLCRILLLIWKCIFAIQCVRNVLKACLNYPRHKEQKLKINSRAQCVFIGGTVA
jgi:hypothetical protein